MNRTNSSSRHCSVYLFIFAAVLSLLSGCTKTIKVEVPPRVSLEEWPVIGFIGFTSSDRHAELASRATQSFIAKLQNAQPGVRLLELGDKDQLLQTMHARELDPGTIKAIGTKYGVQAVLSGQLDVTDSAPSLKLAPDLSSASARAVVRGSLSAKLQETSTGAIVWSNGAHGKWSIAGVTVRPTGLSDIGYADANDQYEKMLRELTHRATADFRPRYEEREIE